MQLEHIEYQVDYLFKNCENTQLLRDFVKHMAKNKNMQLFQTAFVQRQLNYIWKGEFMRWLYIMLAQ